MRNRKIILSLFLNGCSNAEEVTKNGFDLSNSEIPVEKIFSGGPPRDGIPALDQPKFLTIDEAENELSESDPVLGIEINGVSRAYPIAIMNWHEIVNDKIGQQRFAVTYCPLCGSGVVFLAEGSFGVSGLLYNSDVLLYDRETESLWSQILGRAISGSLKGERLKIVSVNHTSWKNWKQSHPDTTVLSRVTGYGRDYSRDPYEGYVDSEGIYFPVEKIDPRYHPKERVLGLEVDGVFRAYPYSELSKSNTPLIDQLNGKALIINYDAESNSGWITDKEGKSLTTLSTFWFAWMAFHPESEVYYAE